MSSLGNTGMKLPGLSILAHIQGSQSTSQILVKPHTPVSHIRMWCIYRSFLPPLKCSHVWGGTLRLVTSAQHSLGQEVKNTSQLCEEWGDLSWQDVNPLRWNLPWRSLMARTSSLHFI
ncbi:hypothetical protein KIL84_009632 [Mauremys mutica]|uniref:Uncharacterized protein n=1 Tax=Mauremys mutica TaxID=74926 RepID=A0A9D3XL41_9SAUR|nr:hypothetical protein KIL84_009632 [Mauremys mutica]